MANEIDLNKVFLRLPEAIVLTDANRHIIQVNPAFERIFGYSSEHIIGKETEFLYAERRRFTEIGEKLNSLDDRTDSVEFEVLFSPKEGEDFIGTVIGSPLSNGERTGTNYCWMIRKLPEQQQLESMVGKFFDLVEEPMCIANLKGYFKLVNRAFEDVLGYSKQDLTSRPFIEFVHPEDREKTLGELRTLDRGEKTLHFENRYKTQSGEYRWLSWNSKVDPQTGLIYATARDITSQMENQRELQEAKNILEQANRDLEAFSYSVSHDLRSPLRAISGFSEILQEEYADDLDDEGQRLLGVVRDNTEKMGTLIDDILAYSRVSRSKPVRTNVNMKRLFEDASNNLLQEYQDLNDKIEITIQDLPPVKGDLSLLRQVATNLLSNAIKYSSDNDTIQITVGFNEDQKTTTYFVRDNGVGFDMKYADKLFGVFQRLHSSTEFEGTGVGLSLVQRIIEHHHGKIWAKSRPDKGATFYFQLNN